MKRSIFDITDDMAALGDLLDQAGGDMTDPAVEDAVLEWIEELEGDLSTKVENYCWLMREKEARAAAMKVEAQRLREQAQVNENAAKGLKDRLLWVFQNKDIDKVETDHFRVSVSNNGGKQPIDIDLDNVDVEYLVSEVVTSIDKDKIRTALGDGVELPFASLQERGQHLRIK
jgi:replicative superfamily II helicase